MKPPSLQEHILSEREFLHAISSPLMLIRDAIESCAKHELGKDEKMAKKLARGQKAIDSLEKQLIDYRANIKQLSELLESE